MNCPNCHADIDPSLPSGERLHQCPGCGSHLLPVEGDADLEGFRARLAQFGLGGERLTRPVFDPVEGT